MRDKVTSSGTRREHTLTGRPDVPPARFGQINQFNQFNRFSQISQISLGEPPA